MRVLFYHFCSNYIVIYYEAENEESLCVTLRINVNGVVYASVWPPQSPDISAAAATRRGIKIVEEA